MQTTSGGALGTLLPHLQAGKMSFQCLGAIRGERESEHFQRMKKVKMHQVAMVKSSTSKEAAWLLPLWVRISFTLCLDSCVSVFLSAGSLTDVLT